MASSGNDGDRLPQFTSSDYEIPSWQIGWNKPWYQQFQGKCNQQSKYNGRGHDLKCRCVLCEEDLESAFSPQPNDSSNLFTKTEEKKSKDKNAFSAKGKLQTPSHTQKEEKVILFSDLPEVHTTTQSASTSCTSSDGSAAGISRISSTERNFSGLDADALLSSMGAIASIQSISDRVTDIRSRVEQFSSDKDSREFTILRGLLVTSLAEISRIDSIGIDWLQQAKNIAVESIHDILTQLQDKVNTDDDY